jgi:EAL domain-containing protein (putative c-di-GMP-specific phosphodiesterase class I)
VVAEGVETEEQAQGFLFSRPVPAEDIEALLKK